MRRPLLLLTLLALAAGGLLAGCDAAQPEEPGALVVEAFFDTQAPPDTVTLRQTLPPNAGGASAATGADVRLTLGDQSVRYRAGSPPGRYVPAREAVQVRAGTPFALRVDWNGQTATAEGRIPPPIRLDTAIVHVPEAPVRTVLVDSLRLDSLDIPAEQGYIYPIEVDLRWTAPAAPPSGVQEHWIHARLRPFNVFSSRVIDFFLQPEAAFRERTARLEAGSERARRWSGVYAVAVDSAEAPLPRHRLRVGLVRSDSTYARFIRTGSTPSEREPDGNVRGALGIAAGVAVDERVHTVSD